MESTVHEDNLKKVVDVGVKAAVWSTLCSTRLSENTWKRVSDCMHELHTCIITVEVLDQIEKHPMKESLQPTTALQPKIHLFFCPMLAVHQH